MQASPSPPEAERLRVRLRINGRVQGVWFRAHTERQAVALGLTGWVRNRLDGSVEALAEGPRAALEQLVSWCHEGSPAARVTEVEATWSEARGDLSPFTVRR